jgi:hypothetical protein
VPCWQTTELKYEGIKVNLTLLSDTIEELRKHPDFIAGRYVVLVEGDVIMVTLPLPANYSAFRLDTKSGMLIYDPGGLAMKNLFKRLYSTQAVKTVANKSRIKQKFKLTQTNEREFVMRRK